MKAIRLHGVGDLRLDHIAEPDDPDDDEIVVRVDAAGICGSDLHNYRTGMWISRAPTVPGHEFCGTVIQAGSQSGFESGQRVVADSRVVCGVCAPCRRDQAHLCHAIGYVGEVCDGGFATLVSLPASQVLRLPDDDIDPPVAAMSEPLAVAAHAVGRLSPEQDAPVVVIGGGAIGALATLLLTDRGRNPVFVVEHNTARRDLVAETCGARDAELNDLAETVGARPRYAIETTGNPAVVDRLLGQIAPGGRVASVGIFHGPATIDLNRIVEGEIDWLGCASFRTELTEVLPKLSRLQSRMRALASAPIALDDVPGAYRALIAGEVATIKTIIRP